jgi:hypothetical protein
MHSFSHQKTNSDIQELFGPSCQKTPLTEKTPILLEVIRRLLIVTYIVGRVSVRKTTKCHNLYQHQRI